MHTLILVRACATEYDRQGRIQGTLDIPLTADGRRQADLLAQEMTSALGADAVSAIYASPTSAAQETAATLAEALDLKPRTADKLSNIDHGLWQGMLVSDVKEKQPRVYRQWQEQPETVCPPQGESVLAAKKRIAESLRKLFKRHRDDDTIALVAPEPLASLVGHVLRHEEVAELWKSQSDRIRWEAIPIEPIDSGESPVTKRNDQPH